MLTEEDIKWYQWDYVIAIKNPDAQKKPKKMKYNKALDLLLSIFRIEDKENDIERKTLRKAEEEVFSEILKGMQDEKGKIPKFKGGRFERIPGKKPLKIKKDTKLNAEEYEDTQTLWNDRGGEPKDLTSLIINVMLYKFSAVLSLDCKIMMSVSGKILYLCLRSDIKDLKDVAEESGYNIQLAIGATDLLSLEPVDKNMIPFRQCAIDDPEI